MAGKQADIKVGVITNYDDKGIKSAETGLKGFSNSIKDADGFTGKLKAGLGSLGSSLKSFVSSPGGMLAAGAAIGAAGEFAIHAVSEFSDLGVEVGKLADATGLSSEAASRWKEVAGDIGVESGTLESSIGKLNKALSANPKLFEDAGIAIARTKDGAMDVNETFLNTVDALNGMKDPAAKAELATKLLGKGWQSMAELIGQGSGKLKTSLDAVSNTKVFDDEKVEKARAFRDATDDLKDVMEDFTLAVGEKATPALIGFAYVLKQLPGQIGTVLGPVGELAKQWGRAADQLLRYVGVDIGSELDGNSDAGVRATESFASLETRADRLTVGTDVLAQAQQGLRLKLDKTTRATDEFKEALSRADLAYQYLTGRLNEEEAWENVNTAMEEFGDNTKATAEDVRNITQDIADYVAHTDTIPVQKKTEILAALNDGDITKAEMLLANLTRTREIYLALTGPGAVTAPGYGNGAVGARAAGGPVSAGSNYLVGEKGPEVVHMGGNGTVIPNNQLGGSHTVNLTVNAGLGANGYEVAKVIVNNLAEYDRRNGTNIVTPAGR